MEELKTGDKIDIKCESGNVGDLEVFNGDIKVENISALHINADPRNGITASLSLISPVIDLKDVTISGIIDSNPKINEIKGIFEDYHKEMEDKKNPSKKDVLEEIANIIYR